MKLCKYCNNEIVKKKDGRLKYTCRKCYMIKYRENNRRNIRKNDKKWENKNIKKTRELTRNSYHRNKEKRRVYQKENYNKERQGIYNRLANLKKNGIIKLEKCERCYSKNNLVMHHEDYNKPFNVEVLCIKCHNQHHHQKYFFHPTIQTVQTESGDVLSKDVKRSGASTKVKTGDNNESKKSCENCEYYEFNFNEQECCKFETLNNSGCVEEIPEKRICKDYSLSHDKAKEEDNGNV